MDSLLLFIVFADTTWNVVFFFICLLWLVLMLSCCRYLKRKCISDCLWLLKCTNFFFFFLQIIQFDSVKPYDCKPTKTTLVCSISPWIRLYLFIGKIKTIFNSISKWYTSFCQWSRVLKLGLCGRCTRDL